MAKRDEEKAELHAGKLRATRFLARSSPSYMEDLDILGMATGEDRDDASTAYDGDVTETGTQAESASQGGEHSGDEHSEAGDSDAGGSRTGSKTSSGGKSRDPTDPRQRAKDNRVLLAAASRGGLSGLWKVRYLLRKPNIRP